MFHTISQENPLCTKNNNRDKLLLTSMADQVENIRGRQKLARGRGREIEVVEDDKGGRDTEEGMD